MRRGGAALAGCLMLVGACAGSPGLRRTELRAPESPIRLVFTDHDAPGCVEVEVRGIDDHPASSQPGVVHTLSLLYAPGGSLPEVTALTGKLAAKPGDVRARLCADAIFRELPRGTATLGTMSFEHAWCDGAGQCRRERRSVPLPQRISAALQPRAEEAQRPVTEVEPPPPSTPGGPGSGRGRWMLGFAGALGYAELKRAAGGSDAVLNPGFFLLPVLHLSAQAGAILGPRLVVGGEASFGMYGGSGGEEYADFNLANFLGVATWFPGGTGFLMRGGLGWAVIHGARQQGSPPVVTGRFAGNGPAGVGGVGYVFGSQGSGKLRLGLDLELQRYIAGSAASDSTWVADLTFGLDWY